MATKTPIKTTPQAVGAAEAAALLGMHWVMPGRLAERGLLTVSVSGVSASVDDPERRYAIYDSAECDANFEEYEDRVAARGGKSERRPRSWLHMRPVVLKHLAGAAPVDFSDALTLSEAAALLGVHYTLVPRMLRAGKIAGRVAWNPRGRGESRVWIVSRASCLANVREVKALEAAGKKPGLPRRKLAK
jgi:hypothetical protein